MNHVFHRSLKGEMPVASHGDGIHIFDSDGKSYIDASGGAAVSCLGHSHDAVISAIKEQLDRIPFVHSGFFTSPVTEELADLMIEQAPVGIERVYFTSGGSEAIEAALKMARQYHIEIGQPQRTKFIARQQSYHGNTLGALAVGGNVWRREPYQPILIDTTHVPPCYAYRGQGTDESEEAYGRRVADELENTILELGAETVCAFVAETVVGATAGVVPPVAGYFKRIREICDKHGVLLILDEVMCGMGRTGSLYACAAEGISPDLLTVAKGLGAGYQPIGAVLVSGKVYTAFEQGSGAFQHGHTYMGHATACAGALAVQKAIRDGGILDNVRRQGEYLRDQLLARLGQNPHVGDVRGRALFWGVELVADRETKEPFDPALGLHKRIKAAAFQRGLICYPGGGTADGARGDHVLLAPPFLVEQEDVDEIVERLVGAIEESLEQINA